MTKHRPPLSIDAGLARIIGQLPGGYAEASALTQRSESLVRKWGDPDCREKISVDDAIVLDLAYQQAGGIGSPIFEAYSVLLDMRKAERFALPIALSRVLPEVMKENSEAEIALANAAQHGANDANYRDTLREADEAIAKWQQVRTLLVQHQTGPPETG